MFSTKLTQAVVNSACHKSLPVVCSRAFLGTKPVDDSDKSTWQRAKEVISEKVASVTGTAQKGSTAGESGRDVRDMGTQKINVPVGQHSKKADSAGQSVRGHDEVSAGIGKTSGTNYQQKRTFMFRSVLDAIDSGSPTGGNDSFVSESAKQNLNPHTSQQRRQGDVQSLDFYPEPPGPAGFLKDVAAKGQNKSDSQDQDSCSSTYSTQSHNPSKTGKEQEGKYFDEAMAGKSGPLVGENEGKPSGQQQQHSSWGGKGDSKPTGSQSRKFSTSASSFVSGGEDEL